jgi:hypothetical protein
MCGHARLCWEPDTFEVCLLCRNRQGNRYHQEVMQGTVGGGLCVYWCMFPPPDVAAIVESAQRGALPGPPTKIEQLKREAQEE